MPGAWSLGLGVRVLGVRCEKSGCLESGASGLVHEANFSCPLCLLRPRNSEPPQSNPGRNRPKVTWVRLFFSERRWAPHLMSPASPAPQAPRASRARGSPRTGSMPQRHGPDRVHATTTRFRPRHRTRTPVTRHDHRDWRDCRDPQNPVREAAGGPPPGPHSGKPHPCDIATVAGLAWGWSRVTGGAAEAAGASVADGDGCTPPAPAARAAAAPAPKEMAPMP